MSPLGLAILSGAGLAKDEDTKHVHLTYDVALNETGTGMIDFESLCDELKLPLTKTLATGEVVDNTIHVCVDNNVRPQALVLDHNGGIIDWVAPKDISLVGMDSAEDFNIIDLDSENPITVSVAGGAANGRTIKLDFYVKMASGATEITVRPEDFGGYFYIEADTLYRNQDGKDMAATLTFPRAKVSSNFTLNSAPTGNNLKIAC